jgi:hypothetical protein
MKNPELFHKTISILVKAYQNETLIHGDCTACAVGNMVADNMGIRDTYTKDYLLRDKHPFRMGDGYVNWSMAFCSDGPYSQTIITEEDYQLLIENHPIIRQQIESTGYSYLELAAIEKAFEANTCSIDPQFDGLMSVVDALMEIHEASKEEVEEAKILFVK